jgi:predicted nucleotidyltransferase
MHDKLSIEAASMQGQSGLLASEAREDLTDAFAHGAGDFHGFRTEVPSVLEKDLPKLLVHASPQLAPIRFRDDDPIGILDRHKDHQIQLLHRIPRAREPELDVEFVRVPMRHQIRENVGGASIEELILLNLGQTLDRSLELQLEVLERRHLGKNVSFLFEKVIGLIHHDVARESSIELLDQCCLPGSMGSRNGDSHDVLGDGPLLAGRRRDDSALRLILLREGEEMDAATLDKLERYFAGRPELGVASVYLFGSHAEGREHRESDIDLAVLLLWDRYPSARERFEARVDLTSDLIHVLSHNDVDLVILNDLPPLFGRRIIWEGRRVFLGDPAADHNYVRDVQLRAADLEPWLKRMRKIQLEALAR